MHKTYRDANQTCQQGGGADLLDTEDFAGKVAGKRVIGAFLHGGRPVAGDTRQYMAAGVGPADIGVGRRTKLRRRHRPVPRNEQLG